MSPVPRSTNTKTREARRKAGRLGGLARGASKRRGDSAYYAALVRKANAARAARKAATEEKGV